MKQTVRQRLSLLMIICAFTTLASCRANRAIVVNYQMKHEPRAVLAQAGITKSFDPKLTLASSYKYFAPTELRAFA